MPRFYESNSSKGRDQMIYPRHAAIAVVLRNDSALLVRRRMEPDAGLWGFPGGHVDLGETVETSIHAKSISLLTNIDVIRRNKIEEIEHHFILSAIKCDYISGEPIAADDVTDAAWFEYSKIFNLAIPMSKYVDTLVKHALDSDKDGNDYLLDLD